MPTPWSQGGAQGRGIPSIRCLAAEENAGGRGRGMNGTHRQNGIWICSQATGPSPPPARLGAVAPWLAEAMGLAWPDCSPSGIAQKRQAYDQDEEAMVAERLRALGYLE